MSSGIKYIKAIPLSFQANYGQYPPNVNYSAKSRGYNIYIMRDGISLLSEHPLDKNMLESGFQPQSKIYLKFSDSNKNPDISGIDELPGKVNYFFGNNPKNWLINIPTYARVKYSELYPGIDMIFYGNNGKLEYDFIVHPGADPDIIKLAFESCENIAFDGQHDLILTSGNITITMHKPVVYQEYDGIKTIINGKFKITGTQISFQLGNYDALKQLIIDPMLTYNTYLGGENEDIGQGIAADSSGCVYIAGYTSSGMFPLKDAFQGTKRGTYDAFVTKLNADGSALIYSTYLGGNNQDYGYGIAVDSSGCAYVTGYTSSSDFPVTSGAAQTSFGGTSDAFVAKLNSSGSQLSYCTYIGGSLTDNAYGISIDSSGCAYITGETESTNFPYTSGAFQTSKNSDFDSFITKIKADGSGFDYSTYLGGNGEDHGYGIAVDSSNCAYVTGYTASDDFPITGWVVQPDRAGSYDAYIAKIAADGGSLAYCTYLGGTNIDYGRGIAVDSGGHAYISGYTDSTDFPVTGSAFQKTSGGGYDAFVSKLAADATWLVYSTYLGGTGNDLTYSIAVASDGCAYISGDTDSTDFPIRNAIQGSKKGSYDAIIIKLNADGSDLVYSTYLGGTDADGGFAIAIDSAGNAYVTGYTYSNDYPVTSNAFQKIYGGTADALAFKINPNDVRRGLNLFQLHNSCSKNKLNITVSDKV